MDVFVPLWRDWLRALYISVIRRGALGYRKAELLQRKGFSRWVSE